MGVNVNANSWGVSNLFTNGTGALTNDGANNEDGLGSFNQTFDLLAYRETLQTTRQNNAGKQWHCSDLVF